MNKILHLDDSQDILELYKEILAGTFNITSISCPTLLSTKLDESIYDAILLDVSMPIITGDQAIKIIRDNPNNKNARIFILTADNSSRTTIEFLKEGICDYLSKTMNKEEIILRLRNGIDKKVQHDAISLGNLSLNKYHLRVEVDNEEVSLTLIEYKIVLYILENKDRIISREETMQFVWGSEIISKNVLNTHLFNLKQKLESWNHEIKSIRFKGITVRSK